jgi:hypothetical protein
MPSKDGTVPKNFHGKKGRSGRKGYGIENAKKHLLEQSYWIVNKKLEKLCIDLNEKEKAELAKQVVLKDMGNKISFDDINDIQNLELTLRINGNTEIDNREDSK